MADAPRSERQELVNSLNETLEMEYKSWLNLSNNASRADLARHVAALANYGGGRILFGIAADMTYVARIQMLSLA
jgi:predicted HTH transcriptional regulator